MNMNHPNERDCEHDQLRRVCPICEAERKLKELIEAVRWERECRKATRWILWNDAPIEAIREMAVTHTAARAAVDALVGEG